MGNVQEKISGPDYLGELNSSIELFSEQRAQLLRQSCSINAQAEYLREATGQMPDEARLIHDAKVNNLYDSPFDVSGAGGTPSFFKNGNYHIYDGKLLERGGIPTEKVSEFNSIDTALENNGRVLIGIDTKEYNNGLDYEYGPPNDTLNHTLMIKEKLCSNNYKVYDPQTGKDYDVHKDVLEEAATEPGQPFTAVALPDPKSIQDEASNYSDHLNEYAENDVKETVSSIRLEEYEELVLGNDINNSTGIAQNFEESVYHNAGAEPEDVVTDLNSEFSNIADVAGSVSVFALTAYFEDNPKMKSRVLKGGITVGVLDSMFEVGDDGVDMALEASPILIASLFVGVMEFMKRKGKSKDFVFNDRILSAFTTAMTVTKYTAISVFALDSLLELNDSFDFGIEVVDEIDGLLEAAGLVADGADIIDGISTLGLSILVSQGIKKYGESKNDKVLQEIGKYREKVEKRKRLGGMLTSDLPPVALHGIKKEFDKS